ncbi:hypothetical protein LRS06_17580 [Hymenobacter sp. J193]|uniref:hypothetical protein n=1 Tax=Hymenobacter sp. J193 TaxID=2898429 RepID=UPI002151C35F|nr:hypothetical protein [Hymenobacter sp. J193]MCR5889549.1 hypothetical protein [Hymenobacter sp. J193]
MFSTRTFWQTAVRLGLVLSISLFVASCISPPEYSDTPSIEFKAINSRRVVDGSGTRDVVTITVAFQDGTGDLGLDSLDIKAAPFLPFNADGSANRYFNNYFVKIFRKDATGVFRSLNLEPQYNSRFDHLAPSDKAAPIKGDLRFTLILLYGLTFRKGDEIRFEIAIADRGLRESNTITTDSIIIP